MADIWGTVEAARLRRSIHEHALSAGALGVISGALLTHWFGLTAAIVVTALLLLAGKWVARG